MQAMQCFRPALDALNPHPNQLQYDGLMTIIQELVKVFRNLKVEKDIYAPFFPTRGKVRTSFEVFRGNQGGTVFLCSFPGLTKRYWDEQYQGWFEILLMPAFVELESVLMG